MSYLKLKDELVVDPLGRGYSGMTSQEKADDLNTAYRSTQFASVNVVRQYLIAQIDGSGVDQRSSIDMIREYFEQGTVRGVSASETAPAARRSAAGMIWYMLQREDSDAGFPLDNSNISANFIAISSDGGSGPSILTNTQLNDIADLGKENITRSIEIGFSSDITADQVDSALNYA